MPDTHRRDRGALAALGLTLASIVCVAWVTSGAGDPPTEQIRSSDAENAEYPPEQYGPAEGHWLPEFAARDTYAQWAMMIFTIAATGVSIWAVRLVRDTLVENRKAVAASENANEIAREIGHAQVRAYLSIVPQEPTDIEGLFCWPAVEIVVQNTGQSPAQNAFLQAAIIRRPYNFEGHEGEGQTADSDALLFNTTFSIGMIGSGAKITKKFRHSRSLTPQDYDAVFDRGDEALFVIALVRYMDIFGKTEKYSRICVRMIDDVSDPTAKGPRYGWQPTRFHNDAT